MKTVLSDRTLWYDGTSEVEASQVPIMFLLGVPQDKIVAGPSSDLALFNSLADDPIAEMKERSANPDFTWKVPEEILALDLEEYVVSCLIKKNLSHNARYIERLNAELGEIQKREMGTLVKTLIYVVKTFREKGQVWGVGRGSSCASLVLFLIGLHQVDPVKFNIPLTEFFHD